MKPNKEKEPNRITVHHLVPRVRLTTYYFLRFNLPKNKLRLREKRHAAWHQLFKSKSLNEIIKYLRQKADPAGYKSKDWLEVFKTKTPRQAALLLERVRLMVRGEYRNLEFEPTLRHKIYTLSKESDIGAVILYLSTKFHHKRHRRKK
jgi:hypothetical protein